MLTPEEYRSATDFLYRTREDWDSVPPDLQEIAKKFLAEIYKYEDYNHDGYEDTLYRGIPLHCMTHCTPVITHNKHISTPPTLAGLFFCLASAEGAGLLFCPAAIQPNTSGYSGFLYHP